MTRQEKIIKWQTELADKRERLTLYKEMEKKILTGAPQSYSLGTRSKTNYNMTSSELRAAIKELEKEIDELEGLINGTNSRKVVSIIPNL